MIINEGDGVCPHTGTVHNTYQDAVSNSTDAKSIYIIKVPLTEFAVNHISIVALFRNRHNHSLY